jgi:hypothetical protein
MGMKPMHDLAPRLDALLADLGGRAIGLWRLNGGRLAQAAFRPAAGLDPEVARQFAEATRSVPLSSTELGIVRAATTGTIAVSRVEELPEREGSGRWLRAFGACCSVAVPIVGPRGDLVGIASIALEQPVSDPRDVAESLRALSDVLA